MDQQDEITYLRNLLANIGGLLQQMSIDTGLTDEQRTLLIRKVKMLEAAGVVL